MARTSFQVTCKDMALAKENTERMLFALNYRPTIEKGEHVYVHGRGFWTARKYIKFEVADANTVILTGWLKDAMGNELALTGFYGFAVKRPVLNTLKSIQSAIE